MCYKLYMLLYLCSNLKCHFCFIFSWEIQNLFFFPMYPFFWSVTSSQNVRNWFPAFRDEAMFSYSRVDIFKKVFGSITIRPLIFIINFGKYLLSEASLHSWRTQTSRTPLNKTKAHKILLTLLCAKADGGSHVLWKCPEKKSRREELLNNKWPHMNDQIAFRKILTL